MNYKKKIVDFSFNKIVQPQTSKKNQNCFVVWLGKTHVQITKVNRKIKFRYYDIGNTKHTCDTVFYSEKWFFGLLTF